MSYSIMYDQQFIISGEGIMPAILAGESNVTTCILGRERLSRDWSIYGNMIGVSHEKLKKSVQNSITKSTCHEFWNHGSKWVDDAGLIRWMSTAIKKAASIEDIIAANMCESIRCYVSVWNGSGFTQHCNTYVKNTEEFDDWIRAARLVVESEHSAYPIVELSNRYSAYKFTHPYSANKLPDKILVKQGKYYVSSVKRDVNGKITGVAWDRKISEALVLNMSDFSVLDFQRYGTGHGEIRPIDAAVLEHPYDAVIEVTASNRSKKYFAGRTSSRVHFVISINEAKRFQDHKQASKYLGKLIQLLTLHGYVGNVADL